MTSTTHHPAGWQLEEGSATAYERYLVPVFMGPWAADLVETVDVTPGERVADVACGTGVVARRAAGHVGAHGEVTGFDVNPSMLAVAQERAARSGLPIRWEEAPVEALPLPDGGCDVVLCQQGLQFFTDRSAALEELFRITKPGGRLGLSTCRGLAHQPGYAVLAEVLSRHAGAAGDVIASPYALGDLEEVRMLVSEAGFTDVRARIRVWGPRFGSAEALLRAETMSSPLGDFVTALDPHVQQSLVDDLTRALVPHTDDEGVTFCFETLLVTAMR